MRERRGRMEPKGRRGEGRKSRCKWGKEEIGVKE